MPPLAGPPDRSRTYALPIAGPPHGPDILSDDRRDPEVVAEDVAPSPRRPWWRQRGLVLALVFGLGAAAGALGWDRWRDDQAVRERESTVRLFARTSSSAGDPASVPALRWSTALVVTNAGPLPVTVEDAELHGIGLTGSIRPVSQGVAVRPAADAFVALDITADCEIGQFQTPSTITLRVRTADGEIRAARARLTDEAGSLVSGAEQRCNDPAAQLVLDLSATGPPRTGEVGGRPAVTVPVEFQTYGVALRSLTSVEAIGGGVKVTAVRLPVPFSEFGVGRTLLTWQVGDCAAATGLGYRDFQLQVVARWTSGAAAVAVPVDYDTALAVQRLVDRACPA